jgi:hypothetical protein
MPLLNRDPQKLNSFTLDISRFDPIKGNEAYQTKFSKGPLMSRYSSDHITVINGPSVSDLLFHIFKFPLYSAKA